MTRFFISSLFHVYYSFFRFINYVNFQRKNISLGHNVQIRGLLRIFGNGFISLGDNTTINTSFYSNPIGFADKTIFNTFSSGRILIGSRSGVSNSSFMARNLISIGSDVKIGNGCSFFDNDFHSLQFENRTSMIDNDIKTCPITIEDGVFIGAYSIILKGVSIGEKSIVGAGSVVAKSIPPGQVWAGNPARFIRTL